MGARDGEFEREDFIMLTFVELCEKVCGFWVVWIKNVMTKGIRKYSYNCCYSSVDIRTVFDGIKFSRVEEQ